MVGETMETSGHATEAESVAERKSTLSVDRAPRKRSYKPGEAIGYEGLEVTRDGEIVTEQCELSVPAGTVWGKDDKAVTVSVTLEGAEETAFKLRRKKTLAVPVLCLLLAIAVVGGICASMHFKEQPVQGETGSYLIPKGDMTDEEAQALVDEMAEKSRITVSLAPNMVLREDGALRVNFIVVQPNNGYSERLEIEQDGNLVYRSGVVEPGYRLEWGSSEGAHIGTAVATVYAVSDGADSGNPISVEVQVVGSDFDSEGEISARTSNDAATGDQTKG